jgi:serine/threonine protein kinase
MAGPKLDEYQLGPAIGVGTVGTIFSATEKATGQVVAIKRLHAAVSRDPLIGARFRREMTILARLRHPNIITYYGGGEDKDGNLFYIMELVEGGSVRDLMTATGALPWQVVVNCGRQICSALQCAHNHGVIHRDLKPGNLFLTRDGVVKLGDFGIARDVSASDLTAEGLTVGTHAYMAPEQITGDASISGKADLYALGCCLYEMLTARKPYTGETFPQLFEQHLRATPPKASDIAAGCPAELDQVIVDLLAKKPEDRPFNARNVQAKMLQIAEKYHIQESAPATPSTSKVADVSAGQVSDIGQRMLKRHIEARLGAGQRAEITWKKVSIVLAIIIVLGLCAMAIRD